MIARSGWGAVWIGKVRSEAVGCVAAAMGLVGIFGGSYGLYRTGCWYDGSKVELRRDFHHTRSMMDGGWDERSDAEKEALFEHAYEQALDSAPGYFATIAGEPLDLMIMIVFAALGLYYGFRVGAG